MYHSFSLGTNERAFGLRRALLTGVDGFNLECGVPVVVFNIGGNKYRLVARIYYDYEHVYVKAVLTHKEYDAAKWQEQICLGLI